MNALLSGLGLNELLLVVLVILAVVFILKKLFKLALTIAVIAALIHFGLPLIQTTLKM